MNDHVKHHDDIIDSSKRALISLRYRTITKASNQEFYQIQSDRKNSLYVGSYGRGTAINTSYYGVAWIRSVCGKLSKIREASLWEKARYWVKVRILRQSEYPIKEATPYSELEVSLPPTNWRGVRKIK